MMIDGRANRYVVSCAFARLQWWPRFLTIVG